MVNADHSKENELFSKKLKTRSRERTRWNIFIVYRQCFAWIFTTTNNEDVRKTTVKLQRKKRSRPPFCIQAYLAFECRKRQVKKVREAE